MCMELEMDSYHRQDQLFQLISGGVFFRDILNLDVWFFCDKEPLIAI